MKARNAVKIGREYIPVNTLEEAVTLWEEARAFLGCGASEAPIVTACIDRKLYRIAYNGRAFDAGTGVEIQIGERVTASNTDWSRFR